VFAPPPVHRPRIRCERLRERPPKLLHVARQSACPGARLLQCRSASSAKVTS
jgi:hypothetical protein